MPKLRTIVLATTADAALVPAAASANTYRVSKPDCSDGDGNCDARPDLGAYEAPARTCLPPAPPAPPSIQPNPPARDATAPVVSHLRLSALARVS